MNDTAFIANSLTASIIDASLHYEKKPDYYTPYKILWEDATDKQKETLTWHINDLQKWAIARPSVQELKDWNKWRLEHMFDYILEKYGIKMAFRFYKNSSWADKFEKYEVKPQLNFPYCQYNDGQCVLFCPYYEKGCTYENNL